MSRDVHQLKDVLLRHEAVHLVASKDVGFLQRLYCNVLAVRHVLRQHHLKNTWQLTLQQSSYAHSVLTAISPGERGLAGCPISSGKGRGREPVRSIFCRKGDREGRKIKTPGVTF